MSREARMVPPDWQHPVDQENPSYPDGGVRYRPLFEGDFKAILAEWQAEKAQWDAGLKQDYSTDTYVPREGDELTMSFDEWHGSCPVEDDYMPDWPQEQRTHYMMYETCSEGTPISPAFENPEKLARWLADTGASAFADMTSTYEEWLATINAGGSCGSCIIENGIMRPGTAFAGGNE